MSNPERMEEVASPVSRFSLGSSAAKALLILSIAILYVLLSLPPAPVLGNAVGIFATLPVIAAGWHFGLRGGVLAGSLAFPLHSLFVVLTPNQVWSEWFLDGGGLWIVALPLVGAVSGRLRDLREQANQELAQLKLAEDVMRANEKKYRVFYDSLNDGIARTDLHGRITDANPAYLKMLGYTLQELRGKKTREVTDPKFHDAELANIRSVLEGKAALPFEKELVHKNGTQLWGEVHYSLERDDKGSPAGLLAVITDISQRKHLEGELLQSRKLEIVGQLASGMAHEVNNPLAVILGFSQLLLARELPEDVRKDAETIFQEAQRASNAIKDLLSFARRRKTEKVEFYVVKSLQRILALKAHDFRVNEIEVETLIDADLPKVMADEQRLQQVFLNIVTNAQHAVSDSHKRGRLVVRARKFGENVRLSFEDNGIGIPKQNLDKIFDPFFTTKGSTTGVGLGLSVSYAIVQEAGGRLWAESEEGKGATFVMELPGLVRQQEQAIPGSQEDSTILTREAG